MRKHRKLLLIISFLTMGGVLGFIVITNGTDLFQGLNIFIFTLIIIGGVFAFITATKRDRQEKEGLPIDDELSTHIKHKTGYYQT